MILEIRINGMGSSNGKFAGKRCPKLEKTVETSQIVRKYKVWVHRAAESNLTAVVEPLNHDRLH